MQEEKKLQTLILNDLRSLGKYCEATKLMKASDNGEPDVYLTTALTGSVWIETKRRTGKAAKLQAIKVAKLNMCGTLAYICHTWVQWYALKRELGLLDMNKIKQAHDERSSVLS